MQPVLYGISNKFSIYSAGFYTEDVNSNNKSSGLGMIYLFSPYIFNDNPISNLLNTYTPDK